MVKAVIANAENISQSTLKRITEKDIRALLKEVMDPEIPRLSVVDLGMITGVNIDDENKVEIIMTPTFAGCPAVDILKSEIKNKILELPVKDVDVKVNFDVQWTSDMISDEGKKILKESGFSAPPKLNNNFVSIEMLTKVECPFCGSKKTRLQSPFGATLCRAMHYCDNCHQAFEQFKPI